MSRPFAIICWVFAAANMGCVGWNLPYVFVSDMGHEHAWMHVFVMALNLMAAVCCIRAALAAAEGSE